MHMKRIFYLVPVLGLMLACSGAKQPSEKSPEVMQEQIEAMETSVQQLDESIQSLDYEMEQTQSEIDSLLNSL